MACAWCEQKRQAMKAWLTKKAEHAARLSRIRGADATQTTDAQASDADPEEASAGDSGQAEPAGDEHEQRPVEADKAMGAGEGRP